MSVGTTTTADSLRLQEILDEDAFRQYGQLLDRCFPVPAGHHFFDDFPIWDPHWSVPQVRRFGIFSGPQLVSCAGVRLATLKISVDLFPRATSQHSPPWSLSAPQFTPQSMMIALIGGVATDPSFAKQGLASRAVTTAVDWAEKKGAGVTFLWSSDHPMYERLGFAQFGQQQLVALADLPKLHRPTPSHVHEGWNPHLFDLRKIIRTELILPNRIVPGLPLIKTCSGFTMVPRIALPLTSPSVVVLIYPESFMNGARRPPACPVI